MKELSLNILDIAENSYKAEASVTEILLIEDGKTLSLTVKDNGKGMTKEVLLGVTDPFYTTRKTRSVGLGLPLLKLEAEQTGGHIEISSRHKDEFPESHGTQVTAVFYKDHIDCPPLGDVISTVVTLVQGHPDTDTVFTHKFMSGHEVVLDTREMRAVLGELPLDTFEVLEWIKGTLEEQYTELSIKK